MRVNGLDRAIAYFAPSYALKRAHSRSVFEAVAKRGFDGAKKGKRLGLWGSYLKNPNQDIQNDRNTLIARSRDLEQNDPYASGGFGSIVSNVVAGGIIPNLYIFRDSENTEPSKRRKLEALDELLEEWADNSDCDYMDQTSLYGIQGLVVRTISQSGMCFVIRHKDLESRNIPLRLKVHEPDMLDVDKNLETDQRIIFRGIEISKKTRRVTAYWFRTEHPDGGISNSAAGSSERIDVKDVLAPFMILRPGQLMGVPWLYSAMVRLHDFSKYEDAQLVKQQVSALTVTYITRTLDSDADLDDEEDAEKIYESREPGANQYLNPGESVIEANPPSVDGYTEFSQNTLRGVARALGLTYEEFTGDYSNVNFSSARMGWVSMNRNNKVLYSHMLQPMFLDKLGRWIIEDAQSRLGDLSFVRIKWNPPRREVIDPLKETSANALALETMQTTLTEIYAESGRDFKKAVRERRDEIKLLNEAGIKIKGINLNVNVNSEEDEEDEAKSA